MARKDWNYPVDDWIWARTNLVGFCGSYMVLPEFSARNILNVSKMLIPFLYMIFIFYIILFSSLRSLPISRLNFAAVFSCQGLGITGIAGSLGQVNVAWECLGHFFTNPGTFTAIYCNYCLIAWISMSIFSANIWTTLGLGICHAHQHWPPLPTNPLDEWSLKMYGIRWRSWCHERFRPVADCRRLLLIDYVHGVRPGDLGPRRPMAIAQFNDWLTL